MAGQNGLASGLGERTGSVLRGGGTGGDPAGTEEARGRRGPGPVVSEGSGEEEGWGHRRDVALSVEGDGTVGVVVVSSPPPHPPRCWCGAGGGCRWVGRWVCGASSLSGNRETKATARASKGGQPAPGLWSPLCPVPPHGPAPETLLTQGRGRVKPYRCVCVVVV